MRKERPILFSTMMVQALLAGRKTMTRREIKEPWLITFLDKLEISYSKKDLPDVLKRITTDKKASGGFEVPCRIGQIGDLLWVREAFWRDFDPLTQAFNDLTPGIDFGGYRADQEHGLHDESRCLPGMFLPKEYSRIWLEITDIKIERLNKILEADAAAEGVKALPDADGFYMDYLDDNFSYESPIESFKTLWQSINGVTSWDANPWVWAISFKVLSTNGRPALADQEAATA